MFSLSLFSHSQPRPTRRMNASAALAMAPLSCSLRRKNRFERKGRRVSKRWRGSIRKRVALPKEAADLRSRSFCVRLPSWPPPARARCGVTPWNVPLCHSVGGQPQSFLSGAATALQVQMRGRRQARNCPHVHADDYRRFHTLTTRREGQRAAGHEPSKQDGGFLAIICLRPGLRSTEAATICSSGRIRTAPTTSHATALSVRMGRVAGSGSPSPSPPPNPSPTDMASSSIQAVKHLSVLERIGQSGVYALPEQGGAILEGRLGRHVPCAPSFHPRSSPGVPRSFQTTKGDLGSCGTLRPELAGRV